MPKQALSGRPGGRNIGSQVLNSLRFSLVLVNAVGNRCSLLRPFECFDQGGWRFSQGIHFRSIVGASRTVQVEGDPNKLAAPSVELRLTYTLAKEPREVQQRSH